MQTTETPRPDAPLTNTTGDTVDDGLDQDADHVDPAPPSAFGCGANGCVADPAYVVRTDDRPRTVCPSHAAELLEVSER
jgi:hypothetical protein